MPFRDLVLLVFFVASLPICFIRPFYGILLWMIVAFLNPQSFLWGSTSFPWALAVAIPTLAGFVIFSRGWQDRIASREMLLLLALWAWFTATSIISSHTPLFMHHAVDTWAKWRFVSKILLMTVVTMVMVDTFERLRILVLTIAGCFGFYVSKCFPFIILTGGAYRLYGPENSMIADNNDFGLALNMSLPFFFFLAQSESKPWVKRLFSALFVITIPAIFFTYSRGALVGLLIVLALMFLRLPLTQRLMLTPVIIVGIGTALFFAPKEWKDRMDFSSPKVVDASARERLNAWAFARNLASDYPITGGGFSTFTPELFERYAPDTRDIHASHSVYFGLLAEHGAVGLGLYLVLVLSCFLTGGRIIKMARIYQDRVIDSYVNMFRFSTVAFLVSGIFLGRAYFDYYFTVVACTVILARVAPQEWARHEEEAEAESSDDDDDELWISQNGVPLWSR